MSEPFVAEPVEQELEEEDQALPDKAEVVPNVRDDPEIKDGEAEQGFADGLVKLQQHYGSSDFEVGENVAFRLLEQADGTFLIDYGNGFEPVTGDDTTGELLQDGPVVKVDAQGNGGTVFMHQGSTPTAAGTVHHIASQGFRYVGERPNGIDDEPTADGEPEGRETVSSHSNNAEIIPLSPREKTAWFDKFFDEQATQEQAISFLPLNENMVDHQEAADKITELFPSTVTAISPQATEVKSLDTVFQEVAAAPVGTQVVIPGEPVLPVFEDAHQVVQDAIVVRRVDAGVSLSFVELASLPLSNRHPEVSLPPLAEVTAPAEAKQVEKNVTVVTLTGPPDMQRVRWNEQPLPAIDGLPIARHHLNVPSIEPPKPVLDRNVLHNPSPPPLIRGGNSTLPPDKGDTGGLKTRSESAIISELTVSHAPDVSLAEASAAPWPTIVAESPVVFDQAPLHLKNTDYLVDSPTIVSAKQTPGVGFVRMVETSSAQPVLPKSIANSSVVLDQAPAQREKRDDLTDITTTISGIRESAAAKRVQQEAATGVQHEPSLQLPPQKDIQNNITVQTTSPGDRPAVVSSLERAGSEPAMVQAEEPPFENKEDVVTEAVSARQEAHQNVAPSIERTASAQSPEPAYLFAPLITSAPNKTRHVIRIEATNTNEAQQQSPLASRDTRPELLSEVRRRVGSPGARGNRAAQIVAIPPARATTQTSI